MLRSLALLATTMLALAGCPGNQASPPAHTCRAIGDQCKLGGGQLGVCSSAANGKIECVSQH